jgi:hypothetical protein
MHGHTDLKKGRRSAEFMFLLLDTRVSYPKMDVGNIYTPVILLKPTGHVMHQQFNIQQLYALPTLYLCVLYLSENKQRFVPFIS